MPRRAPRCHARAVRTARTGSRRCSQHGPAARCPPGPPPRETRGVIHEVDSALRALIEREATGTRDVEVVFDAPDQGLGGPAQRAHHRRLPLRHPRGPAPPGARAAQRVRRRPARQRPAPAAAATSSSPTWSPPGRSGPRTSTGCSPSLLACFLRHEALPAGPARPGRSPSSGCSVPLTIALPPPEDRSFADVWSALGGELKPSLDVVVSAPTWTGRVYPVGRTALEHRPRCRWVASTRLAAARDVPQPRRGGRPATAAAADAPARPAPRGSRGSGRGDRCLRPPARPARRTSRSGSGWPSSTGARTTRPRTTRSAGSTSTTRPSTGSWPGPTPLPGASASVRRARWIRRRRAR